MQLTSEREDLRAAVRGLLDRYPLARHRTRRRASPLAAALRRDRGGRLGIPERFGGAGAGPVEVHIVMEELGRSLTPSPMLGSAVLATQALLTSGDEAACERLLPGLADGSQTAALAWTTAAGRWDPAESACRATPVRRGQQVSERPRRRRRSCVRRVRPDRRSPLRTGRRPRVGPARSRPDAGRWDRPVRGATRPATGDAQREHQRR